MQEIRPLDYAELRARAEQYREMAGTARMVGAYDALLRLAGRFERLAADAEAATGPAQEAAA